MYTCNKWQYMCIQFLLHICDTLLEVICSLWYCSIISFPVPTKAAKARKVRLGITLGFMALCFIVLN